MVRIKLLTALHVATFFVTSINAAALPKTQTCQKLVDRFGQKVSLPSSEEYGIVAPENWSEAAQLMPSCVFEPDTAADVADGLRILVSDGTKFAVRGGGHMPVPGASNINGGVLISLNNMRTMALVKNNTIAQLGPGLRWGEVYNWTSTYGLGVSGGRYSPVGVPGYLIAGGINYFGSRYGWSSNTVTSFQVVLANSSIITADAQTNPDLFWALKGGSSNYGIVTRFELKTFPLTQIYGGTTLYQPQYLDDFIKAVQSYSVVGGGSDDVDASYNPSVQVNVSTGAMTLLSFSTHIGSDPNPAAFSNFSSIPKLVSSNRVRPNLGQLTAETNAPVYFARTKRQLFWSTSLKAGPEAILITNATFFETLASMPELQKVEGLSLTTTPQLLSRAWLKAAKASGGDPMDLESETGIITHLITSVWENEADDDVVYEFNKRCTAAIEKKAKKKGLSYPFIYLNDAGGDQKPFQLYGQGKSINRMRKIREAYDPKAVFQKLLPGGFKLGY
ncbi:hypothetical protein F4802DRAFT_612274 [Xylaria palmicola]|nr:hypothetical protein F4802DRAFT_612274 [Xylaria palmicola]